VRPGWESSAARAVLAAGIAIAALAGCGEDDDGADTGGGDAPTELEVALDPDGPGGAPEARREVVCEAGEADAACSLAAELSPAALGPVPPNTPCTKIYGGPQVATIEGLLDGESVDVRLTRVDGCEIERYQHAAPLLAELFPDYVGFVPKPGPRDAPRSR
jgi:hypothetical protein